jgi:uncharacterized membrane protein
MKIESEILITAPMIKVFNAFSDISKIEERISGIQKVEILSDMTSGVGTRWIETRVMFGKEATEEMEIVKMSNNESYIVEAESHGTKYKSIYMFKDLKDGNVKVNMTFEGTPISMSAKIMSLIGFFFKGATKRALENDMVELKAYCELSE